MDRRRLIAVLCAAIVGWSATIGGMAAQEPEPGPGGLVLANGPELTFSGVIAPASGALFVVGQGANQGLRLLRSDDGGDAWRPVPLPPPAASQPQVLAIDPTNHVTLYGMGAEGLYKSADDGASWRPLLPIAEPNVTIAVSPADSNLLYLGLRTEKMLRIVRSQDGGESWETTYAHESAVSKCDDPLFISPHPVDANRVFANVTCEWQVAGDLYQSQDRGTTWEAMVRQNSSFDNGYPIAVAGAVGAAPNRLYAAFTDHYAHNPGFQLDLPIYRSDDDGRTWRQRVIVSLKVGGPKSQERNDAVLEALVMDPTAPDRLYVGLKNARSEKMQPLLTSGDGGTSWQSLDIGEAKDVVAAALGVDRQNLYAVTEQGLYRIRLR